MAKNASMDEGHKELLKEVLMLPGPCTVTNERIYLEFKKTATPKERVAFLKEEYGIGGGSCDIGGHTSYGYDAKGIKLSNAQEEILFSWSEAEKALCEIVRDNKEKYVNTLYGKSRGIICLPSGNGRYGGLSTEGRNEYFRMKEYIYTLYPKVQQVLRENHEKYPYDALFGRIQRVNIARDGDLQVALLYCFDEKGAFSLQAYEHQIASLLKKYGNETAIRVPAEIWTYADALERYYGVPEKYTAEVFGLQQTLALQHEPSDWRENIRTGLKPFWECYTTCEDYRCLSYEENDKEFTEREEER